MGVAEQMTVAASLEEHSIPEPNSGCWLWIGADNGKGYGIMTIARRKHYAHRVSYEMACGEIPAGLHLDHLCRTRCCINPKHLEPVTRSVNALRSPLLDRYSHRTHCLKGHEYTPENTRVIALGRVCRACQRDWQREARQRKAARLEIGSHV